MSNLLMHLFRMEDMYQFIFCLDRQFGGFAGESEYRAEALRLTRTLGETAPFQRKQYFCCSFDPPLKPYGRRNEVWFLQEEP